MDAEFHCKATRAGLLKVSFEEESGKVRGSISASAAPVAAVGVNLCERETVRDSRSGWAAVVRGGIAGIAAFALLLQLYLMIAGAPAGGFAVATRLVNYFSFFTILTNLLVAIGTAWPLLWPGSRLGKIFSGAPGQAALAVYISIVGATYFLLLRHAWDPQGADKLADVLLHYVVPLAYVGYWLVLAPTAGLRWKHAVWWLVYPLAYTVYTLIHGALTGWYPYPFVDVTAIGYPLALANGAAFLLLFYVVGCVAVAFARWRERRTG